MFRLTRVPNVTVKSGERMDSKFVGQRHAEVLINQNLIKLLLHTAVISHSHYQHNVIVVM